MNFKLSIREQNSKYLRAWTEAGIKLETEIGTKTYTKKNTELETYRYGYRDIDIDRDRYELENFHERTKTKKNI